MGLFEDFGKRVPCWYLHDRHGTGICKLSEVSFITVGCVGTIGGDGVSYKLWLNVYDHFVKPRSRRCFLQTPCPRDHSEGLEGFRLLCCLSLGFSWRERLSPRAFAVFGHADSRRNEGTSSYVFLGPIRIFLTFDQPLTLHAVTYGSLSSI